MCPLNVMDWLKCSWKPRDPKGTSILESWIRTYVPHLSIFHSTWSATQHIFNIHLNITLHMRDLISKSLQFGFHQMELEFQLPPWAQIFGSSILTWVSTHSSHCSYFFLTFFFLSPNWSNLRRTYQQLSPVSCSINASTSKAWSSLLWIMCSFIFWREERVLGMYEFRMEQIFWKLHSVLSTCLL